MCCRLILLPHQEIARINLLHLGRFAASQAPNRDQLRSLLTEQLRLGILSRDTIMLAVAGLKLTTLMV